jgi:antitoxin component YwqK of YwqJK toxin-antitoxin module
MLTKAFKIVKSFVALIIRQKRFTMKKLQLIIALFATVSTLAAQSSVEQNITNSYILNGDFIEAKLYHDNGQIAQTGFYTKENKLHGEWISYDTEGNKTAVAQYENGKKVGVWTFYQGDERKEVSYVDSKIAEVKTWKILDTQVVMSNK